MQHSKQQPNDNTSDIKKYIQSIDGSYNNEEILHNIQNGIDKEKNMNLLLKNNAGLVHNVAKKCTYNIPYEDKVQYCYEGLLHAIKNFDTTRGYLFSTYAHTSMRNFVYRYGSSDNSMIAFPEYLSTQAIQVNQFKSVYYSKYGKEPSTETIMTNTGLSENSVKYTTIFKSDVISYDNQIDDTEGSNSKFDIFMTSNDSSYLLNEDSLLEEESEILDEALSKLSTKECLLLSMFHGLGKFEKHTVEEIIAAGFTDISGKPIKNQHQLYRSINGIVQHITEYCKKNIHRRKENEQ